MKHLQSIQEIFQDKLFKIPDYQRGYAWEKKQWQDLIDDLELMEDSQEHYTGTLVIHSSNENDDVYDDDGNVFKQFDVVDGQQRLTTISILINELSSEFIKLEAKGKQLSKGIKKKYIFSIKDDEILPKLTLNRDTNEFYKKNIISDKASVAGANIMSEQRLIEAKKYFKVFFEQKHKELDDNYFKWLEKFYAKISSKMKLTVYQVPKATEVGVIFEVMNNRGKQLTEMEKVKNYLLYLASKLICSGGKELGENINQTWTYIFESLMLANASGWDENQLLRNNWIMSMEYNPKKWDGCDSIKSKFNLKKYKENHEQLRNDIRNYVNLLRECCTAYCDIINPKRDGAFSKNFSDVSAKKDIAEMTVKILRIGAVASFMPVLFAVRLKYPDNNKLYFQFLELCEKFAFRVYRYAGRRSNAGQTTLFKYGYELFNDIDSVHNIYDKIRSLLLHYAPNNEFEQDTNRVGDNWYDWFGIKYLLYEYELHCASKNPVLMDWVYLQKKDKQDSIEHILPQTPNKPYWKNNWTKVQINEATHDIGNLVITFDNSVYSNNDFETKKGIPSQKGCYSNSSLFSERELTTYEDWTYEIFMQRREKISQWILERWKVEEDKILDIEIEEDEEESIEIAQENLN